MSFYPDKASPYITRHRGFPVFRIRIPADLQPCLGRAEYRRSLGRCYASEAKIGALRLAIAAFEVFAFVRQILQVRKNRALTLLTVQGKENNANGYTSLTANSEKHLMNQASSHDDDGYTHELSGRTLGSLTDDEIRFIAVAWLLAALKGSNSFTLR